jgi:hypothetical protein
VLSIDGQKANLNGNFFTDSGIVGFDDSQNPSKIYTQGKSKLYVNNRLLSTGTGEVTVYDNSGTYAGLFACTNN